MKHPLRVFAMAMAILAVCVIIPWSWDATRETWFAARGAFTKWQDARPPRPLPERKGDRERYPRRAFGLVLESTRGIGVNTFSGTATKDLIDLPDTTIKLWLSDAQLDTLYDLVIGMRLFDDARSLARLRSEYGLGGDYTQLTVRAGTSRAVLAWPYSIWWSRPEPVSDDWKRLDSLLRTIGRMVRDDPAYAALPTPKGVYID